MDKCFVKPGVGLDGERLVTRNPATGKPLSSDGEWVDHDGTTRRRLRDKDWQTAEAPAPVTPAPPVTERKTFDQGEPLP